ncbi:hypothetical protein GOP47_0018549 [Adiantum capillus-veneris]|uniref:C2 domain-containing protein n=1 Tax=Adiantum capillus-veneris TaxID=13818 RepID=A0A9D4UDR9_ADICA|nr:hypothetical protein GOP47_0018549 [Adiantum capillus-veneris]
MEQRAMQVTFISAHDLKDVSRLGKLRPYAEAWVDPCAKQATPLYSDGGTNPTWNHTLSFTIPEASFHHPSARLFIRILHKTHIPRGAAFIGSVSIPLHQLLQTPNSPVSYALLDASESCGQGSIQLRIHLGDKHFLEPSVQQGATICTGGCITTIFYHTPLLCCRRGPPPWRNM